MDIKVVQFMPQPKELLTQFQSGDKPLTVAARITGRIKTAFPGGDPARPAPAEGQPAPADSALKESAQDANIVVVADCDMLADRFWVQEARIQNILLGYSKFADNGDFVISTVDNLSGSNELISLRARNKSSRPFDRVEKIQRAAETRFLAEEKRLRDEFNQAETRIRELKTQGPQGAGMVLTPEIQAELDKLYAKKIEVNKNLRNVQHQMRKDIEGLGTTLKFANIGLMPLAVGVLAVGMSLYRVNRRRSIRGRTGGTFTP
jgi:ABC-type uncharacterized transport system involved in gliding motility auxiliary subunit